MKRRYVFKLIRFGQKEVHYFQAENQSDLVRYAMVVLCIKQRNYSGDKCRAFYFWVTN